MPIHDYRCSACGAAFELLVRGGTVPACRQCGSTTLERQVSPIAPHANSPAVVAAGRRAAAKQGHFSHYSTAERAKVSK